MKVKLWLRFCKALVCAKLVWMALESLTDRVHHQQQAEPSIMTLLLFWKWNQPTVVFRGIYKPIQVQREWSVHKNCQLYQSGQTLVQGRIRLRRTFSHPIGGKDREMERVEGKLACVLGGLSKCLTGNGGKYITEVAAADDRKLWGQTGGYKQRAQYGIFCAAWLESTIILKKI